MHNKAPSLTLPVSTRERDQKDSPMPNKLSHVNAAGHAQMVDVSAKAVTAREAVAAGADVLVAGTASFTGGPDAYAANLRRLRGH